MKKTATIILFIACLAMHAAAFSLQVNSPQDASILRTRPIVLNYTILGYESPYHITVESDVNGILLSDAQAPYERRVMDMWLDVGKNTVTITAIDQKGHRSIKSITLTVEEPQLAAGIASPLSGTYSGSVDFAADIVGSPPYKVLWSSDVDGVLGREQSFSRALSKGRHTITLKVVDSVALVAYDSAAIDFKPAPQLIITSPQYDIAYGTVGFQANITGGAPPYDIVWSSDRDGVLGTTSALAKELSGGEHIIKLKVTDSEGASAEKEKKITVKPALRVEMISPANGTYRGLLVFNASISGGISPYSIVWESSRDGFLSGEESFEKELSSGEHIITAKVFDGDQYSAEGVAKINILEENYMEYAVFVLGMIVVAYVAIRFWRARNE